MKRHFSVLALLFGLVIMSLALLGLLNLTNPSSAGLLGILAIFIIIYGISFVVLMLLIRFFEIIFRVLRPQRKTVVNQERTQATRKRLVLIAAVLAFVPIFFISLNSIGQLSFRDVLLIVVIEALTIFYIVRRV